jgi:hypothetical protein
MRKKRRRKPAALFGRVVLPPSRPQTTKKGARGYRRGDARREEREELRESYRRQGRR